MDLSIIIAHFDPGDRPDCVESFYKVLDTIQAQQGNLKVEVIIADDGSPSNSSIPTLETTVLHEGEKRVHLLSGKPLQSWLTQESFKGNHPNHWLYLQQAHKVMCKARLWNHGAELARSEYLLFLDDDNYFLSENTLTTLKELMKTYDVVFGQVEDSKGRSRSFKSHRVQGTSFAIQKDLIQKVGGFGEWTESVSSGIDSDFWWKLYQYHTTKESLRVAYTSAFRTVDSCSKRWKPFVGSFFRHRAVRKQFFKENGCKNYRSATHNPSRDKTHWMTDLT